MNKFTKRQWYTLVVISIADFCNAICVSLQAPFYPKEAELKGATASEYGLVFGVFELVVFLVSPVYGQHLNKIGPKFMFNSGIFTTGTCAILFGLLDKVQGHYPFIILSFTIRITEALGNAAFLTASFAIIAKEFPNNIATTFASLETFFGLGLIIGPTVGGCLYELGGYSTPFAIMGSCLFFSAILTAFVLPDHEPQEDMAKGPSILTALRIPGVFMSAISIVATSMSIGFLQATLEPHLRKFELTPVFLGLMFVINGGTYAITAPIWGWLCDRHLLPKYATIAGCGLVAVGFLLIGPAPFIAKETVLSIIITGLVFHGLGMSAQLVASFTDALRTTVAYGFQNNLETFGLISGLWTSAFALGAFIGPSVSGILYDGIGFRNASMFIFALHILVGLIVALFLIFSKSRKGYVELPSPCAEDKAEISDLGSSIRSASSRQSVKSVRSVSGISIEQSRPAAMNSLIACNSYKSRAWPRRESGHQLGGSTLPNVAATGSGAVNQRFFSMSYDTYGGRNQR